MTLRGHHSGASRRSYSTSGASATSRPRRTPTACSQSATSSIRVAHRLSSVGPASEPSSRSTASPVVPSRSYVDSCQVMKPSRMRALRAMSIVLISMCTAPGRRPASVPASPQTTSVTAAASGTIESRTSDRRATSAGESAAWPPASISSGDPLRRWPITSKPRSIRLRAMGRPILPRPITPTRCIAASSQPCPLRGSKLYADAGASVRIDAMPRVVQIPDIRKVDLPEARQAIPHVHAYLRECILDGTLTPGTKLSQVSLARQLGISRTPLREVLRMLQEEGLVEIEPNQRTRVAGLDPEELDEVYASRILLETLALSMTIGHFGAKARTEAKRILTAMRRAAKTGDFNAWFAAHTEYHRVCTAAVGDAMQRQLRAFADRTTRYIRIYQLSEPGSWQAAGDIEHAAILAALIAGDEQGALTEMAHHLERTALRVLTDCAPDFVPVAVPHAVALIDCQAPAALLPTEAN